MLGQDQADFSYYSHDFKDNYRKGILRLRTLLENPGHAAAFARCFGGVSVVLGLEGEGVDPNGEALRLELEESPVYDAALKTWLEQFFGAEAGDFDALVSAPDRARRLWTEPLLYRAVQGSPALSGKLLSALAGLEAAGCAGLAELCGDRAAMEAVYAHADASAALAGGRRLLERMAAFPAGLAGLCRDADLFSRLQADPAAKGVLEGVSARVAGKAAALLSGLEEADLDDGAAMAAVCAVPGAARCLCAGSAGWDAVCASPVAVGCVWDSAPALEVVKALPDAWKQLTTKVTLEVASQAAALLLGMTEEEMMAAVARASDDSLLTGMIFDFERLAALFEKTAAADLLLGTDTTKEKFIQYNETIAARAIMKLVGEDPQSVVSMQTVVSSAAIMGKVVDSAPASRLLLSSGGTNYFPPGQVVAMVAISGSRTAMEIVARTDTAIRNMGNQETFQYMVNNAAALSLLLENPGLVGLLTSDKSCKYLFANPDAIRKIAATPQMLRDAVKDSNRRGWLQTYGITHLNNCWEELLESVKDTKYFLTRKYSRSFDTTVQQMRITSDGRLSTGSDATVNETLVLVIKTGFNGKSTSSTTVTLKSLQGSNDPLPYEVLGDGTWAGGSNVYDDDLDGVPVKKPRIGGVTAVSSAGSCYLNGIFAFAR